MITKKDLETCKTNLALLYGNATNQILRNLTVEVGYVMQKLQEENDKLLADNKKLANENQQMLMIIERDIPLLNTKAENIQNKSNYIQKMLMNL